MPNVGPLEIIIVLIIALIVFGPKRIPELGKSLGRGIREFKGSLSGDEDDAEDEEQPAIEAGEEEKLAIEASDNGIDDPVEAELVRRIRR